MVTNGWIPGAFGINNDGQVVSLEVRPETQSSGSMVILTADQHHADSDMGFNAWTTSTIRRLVICTAEVRGCMLITTSSIDSLEKIDEEGQTPPKNMYGDDGHQKLGR